MKVLWKCSVPSKNLPLSSVGVIKANDNKRQQRLARRNAEKVLASMHSQINIETDGEHYMVKCPLEDESSVAAEESVLNNKCNAPKYTYLYWKEK